MAKRLTSVIMVAMLAGVVVGYVCHRNVDDPAALQRLADYFSVVTEIFLRLIKMIIAPLVFSTLVVGIAHLGDARSLGRIGARTLGWFILASWISLLLGVLIVTLLQPGASLALPAEASAHAASVNSSALGVKEFVTHLVPRSVFEAMANNEILQIVVFSIFFGG